MDPMHALVDQSSETATSKEINESGRQKSLLGISGYICYKEPMLPDNSVT